MARYAVFRSSSGTGPEAGTRPPEPPVPGAEISGSFGAWCDPETRYHRWVVDVDGLLGLMALAEAVQCKLILHQHGIDPFDGDGFLDGVDGVIEIYDGWRE